MACAFTIVDGALFCVWGEPTLADVEILMKELRAAAAKAGGPIVYVTRIPLDAPTPNPTVRARLNAVMPTITTLCSTYHVVLEGSGFVAAMKRSVLLSLFQISPRRNTFFVHASVDEIASKLAPEKRATLRKLLVQVEKEGLLDCPPPPSSSNRQGHNLSEPPNN
jgi:hypothetical protein